MEVYSPYKPTIDVQISEYELRHIMGHCAEMLTKAMGFEGVKRWSDRIVDLSKHLPPKEG